MKRILASLFIAIVINNANAQTVGLPKGIYMSLSEIRDRTPSKQEEIFIIQRPAAEVQLFGGNDYKVADKKRTQSEAFFKKKVYAVSTGDSMALNGNHFHLANQYALIVYYGKYLVFRSFYSELYNEIQPKGVEGVAHKYTTIDKRSLYVLDTKFGIAKLLTVQYLGLILSNYPELEKMYNAEEHKDAEEVMLKYIKLIG